MVTLTERTVVAVLALLTLAARGAGCRSPAAPSPNPSASPSYPAAKPDATAFENLPLIRSLERSSSRRSFLVEIGTPAATQEGVSAPGDGWEYTFAEIVGTRIDLYRWTVFSTGGVKFRGPEPNVSRLEINDIEPLLVDSNTAARLGREYGAQAYVDRYTQVRIHMSIRLLRGLVVWELSFFAPVSQTGCELPIWLLAKTGELLARDLRCLSSSSN
jgi:hypothetical protein